MMAYVPPRDRVLEHSTSNSQSVFALNGAIDASYNAFSASMSVGDTTIGGVSEPGVAFKCGVLTYSDTDEITVGPAFDSKGTFSSSGTKEVFMGLPAVMGLNTPFLLQNGKLVESHSGNAATYAVKGLNDSDPSATNAVIVIFPDGTQSYITAALSVVIPSGATMGFSNGVAGRLWLALTDDGGTIRLVVRNCSDANGIYGFPGHGVLSSTTIGTGSDSAGVSYSDTGVTSKQFVVIGFADYESGLTTAGTWDVSPSPPKLYAPGMPLPGSSIKRITNSTTSATTETLGAYVTTGLEQAISLSSPCNIVKVQAAGELRASTAGVRAWATLARVDSSHLKGTPQSTLNVGALQISPCMLIAYDKPNTTSSTNYLVMLKDGGAGSAVWNSATVSSEIYVEELMG